ncbi:DNA/RNA non-specific endonuclease [Agaribacterium sp. ZY112]|uniref:DNA/RNA non-specific endonuclease n=1 Tax=Agaribacterium sp. ZY112 TaxID=3233574 RepID=UPI0035258BA1
MTGYNPNHLNGITLPMPTYSVELETELLEEGRVYDYPNYSLVMNAAREKRSLVIAAFNLDQNKLKSVSRGKWRTDGRVGANNQLDNTYYRNNDWDRGHMVRSATAGWGNTHGDAQYATRETYYYTNSSLQHANLNQDEWLHDLEEWVKDLDLDKDGLITTFTGPFYGDNDRTIRPSGHDLALIPAGFFKVVCFINKDSDELDVRAFVMYQDQEALADKRGHTRYNNQNYQVTISEVEQLTGLKFDSAIYHANPLIADPATAQERGYGEDYSLPERFEVARPEDILSAGSQRITILDDSEDVFISAAMPNPEGVDENKEWVAITNYSTKRIDVSAWKLSDNSGAHIVIGSVVDAAKCILAPGEGVVVVGLEPIRLSNKRDVIKLFNENGDRIDWVNYESHMLSSGAPIRFLAPRDTLK